MEGFEVLETVNGISPFFTELGGQKELAGLLNCGIRRTSQ